MKRTGLLFAVLLAVVAAPFTRAEGSLSDAQLEAIRTNCVDAQIGIQRVQENDKLTRINRGYRYEALLKLMMSFNARAIQNKLGTTELLQLTSKYQDTWDSFRTEYTAYDDALTSLSKFDCRTEPTTFNDKLVEARDMRKKLSERVHEFETMLDEYQRLVDKAKAAAGEAK